jgi:hypothetical protein
VVRLPDGAHGSKCVLAKVVSILSAPAEKEPKARPEVGTAEHHVGSEADEGQESGASASSIAGLPLERRS